MYFVNDDSTDILNVAPSVPATTDSVPLLGGCDYHGSSLYRPHVGGHVSR